MQKLADFTGGLNTRFSEHLVPANQGVIYNNIDNSKGALTPVKDSLATSDSVKLWFTYFFADEEWVSFDIPHDFVEYQEVLYYTNRIGDLKRYKDNVESLASLKKLDSAPILALFNEIQAVDSFDVLTIAGDVDRGQMPEYGLYDKNYTYMLFQNREDELRPGEYIYSNPFLFTINTDVQYLGNNRWAAPSTLAGDVTVFDEDYRPITSYYKSGDATDDDETTEDLQFPHIRMRHELDEFSPQAETSLFLYRYYNEEWRLVTLGGGQELESEDFKLIDDRHIVSGAVLDKTLLTPFLGTYQYVITAYNENTFAESAPSPVSDELEANSGTIGVNITVTQEELNEKYAEATHWRIYRIGNNVTAFRLVDQIPKSQLIYEDRKFDNELTDFLVTQIYGAAPVGLKYLVEAYAMLFGADNNRLRYTGIGEPNNWSELYFIEFDSPITGIASVSNGILVFTSRKTHLVTGTSPQSLVTQLLSTDRGCISHDSISNAGQGTVIWAASDTLCASNGGEIISLTKDYLGQYDITEIVRATTHKEVYYLQLVNGKILCWDYGYSTRVPYFLTLNSNNILSVGFDLMLRGDNGLLSKAFQSSEPLELHYKSPKLTSGEYSILKTYNKIYILSDLVNGDADITINVEALKSTQSTNIKITNDQKFHIIYVPQDFQQAYSIQFEIKTKGIIEEIIYMAESSIGTDKIPGHYAE